VASTVDTFAAGLKTRYTNEMVENLTKKDNLLLGLMREDSSFSGDGLKIPIIWNNPQSVSGTRAGAQAAKTNASIGAFTVTTGEFDGEVDVGDRVLKASRDNQGAFLRNKVLEIDGLYESMAERLDILLHGNGGQSLGQVASIDTPTNVITLAQAYTAANFHPNMEIEASLTDGTSGAAKTGSSTITAVSLEGGTITIDDYATIDPSTGPVANDYLFAYLMHAQTSGVLEIHGIGSYITSTASPAALFGLTRTADPTSLAGVRLPSAMYTGLSTEMRLRALGGFMTGRVGGPGPDTILLNPENWENLATGLASRGIRPAEDDTTSFGYMAINAVIGGKRVKIYSDRHQPKDLAFALRMKGWTLHSMLKYIHPIEEDGITILRSATTNDYTYRLIGYPQPSCNAPGHNGRVPLTG
jgi:hypothetical protein